jgi:hypothetical protein
VATQTGRPGVSQARHPRGVAYVSVELLPQGVRPSTSLRGAPLLVAFTNPQQPRYGMGLTSLTPPATMQFYPDQGPIRRGY